jgi:hypothetical protein
MLCQPTKLLAELLLAESGCRSLRDTSKNLVGERPCARVATGHVPSFTIKPARELTQGNGAL